MAGPVECLFIKNIHSSWGCEDGRILLIVALPIRGVHSTAVVRRVSVNMHDGHGNSKQIANMWHIFITISRTYIPTSKVQRLRVPGTGMCLAAAPWANGVLVTLAQTGQQTPPIRKAFPLLNRISYQR